MPVKFEINGVEVINARIDEMMQKLHDFPMGAELTNWQVEDMKRSYPETTEYNPTTVATKIYPRSRTWNDPARRRLRYLVRKAKSRMGSVRRQKVVRVKKGAAGGSGRPILRPDLYARLRERMAALLKTELKW